MGAIAFIFQNELVQKSLIAGFIFVFACAIVGFSVCLLVLIFGFSKAAAGVTIFCVGAALALAYGIYQASKESRR